MLSGLSSPSNSRSRSRSRRRRSSHSRDRRSRSASTRRSRSRTRSRSRRKSRDRSRRKKKRHRSRSHSARRSRSETPGALLPVSSEQNITQAQIATALQTLLSGATNPLSSASSRQQNLQLIKSDLPSDLNFRSNK